MFKFFALLASLVSVAAFAPAGRMARSSSLKMGFENAIGAQAPLGFFDPLGLLKDADQERFDRLRKVEIKHGRIVSLLFTQVFTILSFYLLMITICIILLKVHVGCSWTHHHHFWNPPSWRNCIRCPILVHW